MIKKIVFVSTFPPKECGIATYTESLIDSIKNSQSNIKCDVVAVSDESHDYPEIVKTVIKKEDEQSYVDAAKAINDSDADIVSLQHEFWIYGGYNGRKILGLLKNLKKPVVLTLHSVPIFTEKPFKIIPDRYKSRTKVLKEIFPHVKSVIVMTDSAKNYLCKEFNLKTDQVFVMPHGAPAISIRQISDYRKQKDKLGIKENDFVLATFGLISPKKGIEYVIKALPKIISKSPDQNIKYFITGGMRPGKSAKYLTDLKQLTKKLKLENSVIFDSKYLSNDEIFKYLANTDIFITPYYKKEQTSSGALSYAMAAGCSIVSTPYFFAYDLIKNHKIGELIKFKDSSSIEKTVSRLIKNREKIKNYRENSYKMGQSIEFAKVANIFIKILNQKSI